jgi:two-component system, chemotaxis family, CheB/CheR fusion protein
MSEVQKSEEVSNQFLVVGIGASSGGLDAFKSLVRAIPVTSGMAYILVQHLAPNHESILPGLIQSVTAIPVHEITDKIELAPDHIYVVPSNKLLAAQDGVLRLSDRPASHSILPIDAFFTSLSEVHQSHAIGIVLSGMGKDGTLGLKAIKQQGGITFAQDLHSAAFDEMPQNAVQAKVVDFELTPEAIVHQLVELNILFRENSVKAKVEEDKPEDVYYKKILSLLEVQKGVDFSYYKQSTIRRRIMRRLVLRNLAKPLDYLEDLKSNTEELDILYNDILIPVTEFFRDPQSFEYLTSTVMPLATKEQNLKETFRAWCVGCSSGQEAYSLAISLYEFFACQTQPCKIQVFATDISETGIAHARSGFYSDNEVANVSPERLERYFVRTERGYHLHKTIRDICVFASHNILTNPPFASINLITCRNVLIYMEPFLQRKAMATFHYSLNAKGILFLGRSETVGTSSDLFAPFSAVDKFFTRNSVPGRFIHIAAKRRTMFFANGNAKGEKESRPTDDFQKGADDILLQKAPAGVIVNDRFEILQFRGATGDWLEPASGKPTSSVLKMCKRGLSIDLRNALHKAKTTRLPFVKEGILLEGRDSKKLVTIEVHPILNTINSYFLVLFKNTVVLPLEAKKLKTNGKIKVDEQYVRAVQLEKELSQTREDMRTITEDQEAGNEELLSANEELLSGSEELRSVNEELEISKEELQSTVEELSVANQELSFRNSELNYSRKYAEAIISTISEPLVVLDHDFRVKSTNEAFPRFFRTGDAPLVGQIFFDVDDKQWNMPELKKLLDDTLDEAVSNAKLELNFDFKRIGNRFLLINCQKVVRDATSEQLLLLVIEDITERKNNEESLRSRADYVKLVLDSCPIITSTASAEGQVTYSNKFFLNYSGLTLEQAIVQGWGAVIHPDQNEEVTRRWLDCADRGVEFSMEMLLRRHDGVYRWHLSHAIPIRDAKGKILSWVNSSTEIHDQKMASEEWERQISERTADLKKSNIELEHSNKNLEQFAFIASHDLQEPLRKIQTFSSILFENYQKHIPEEGKKIIGRIHASSERLTALIKDILTFSRIENSAVGFKYIDLSQIMANVIEDFALLIEEKRATVEVDPLPSIEVIPIQINQLFYNLLSNSLKYSRVDDHPVITIRSRKLSMVEVLNYPELSSKLEYFEILFSDNGIGFEPEYQERIFQIFQRLHQRTEYSGTGIGLALCRKIVINHRGLIFAESHKGAGALFHIILPLNDHHSSYDLLPGYIE